MAETAMVVPSSYMLFVSRPVLELETETRRSSRLQLDRFQTDENEWKSRGVRALTLTIDEIRDEEADDRLI